MADHLILLPVVLPLAVAALTLLVQERRRHLNLALSVGTSLALIVIGATLLVRAGEAGATAMTYPLGNWPVPFGIVLVADRIASVMVLLTGVLAFFAMVFASARWTRAGAGFHTLFLVLLTGLNGAFLTGDLFNLFVFFEVLLAASYGLVLHGSGPRRIRAGLHYVAINLAASSLFLIGVALIYGVSGTLNMADLAARIPEIPTGDRGLLNAGMAILGIAFLVKAGMWPLNLWLPGTYAAAGAPVAAIFAVMTKVGVYAVLRLSLLAVGPGDGGDGFGQDFLLVGGLATIVFGTIGVLASQATTRLAGFLVTVSSGTLLAALGTGSPDVLAGALFYLVVSTLTIAAFFLLAELVERSRIAGADVLAVTAEASPEEDDDEDVGEERTNDSARGIPATTAILGSAFAVCAMLFAGLPPLPGFLAKFAMLSPMIGAGTDATISAAAWTLAGILVVSGLAIVIAMVRSGINAFWVTMEDTQLQIRLVEIAPVAALLAICVGLSLFAADIQTFMADTAASLHAPATMIDAVLGAPTVGEATP